MATLLLCTTSLPTAGLLPNFFARVVATVLNYYLRFQKLPTQQVHIIYIRSNPMQPIMPTIQNILFGLMAITKPVIATIKKLLFTNAQKCYSATQRLVSLLYHPLQILTQVTAVVSFVRKLCMPTGSCLLTVLRNIYFIIPTIIGAQVFPIKFLSKKLLPTGQTKQAPWFLTIR